MSEMHNLKIKPKFFKDVSLDNKNFELRKNDRNFKIGDTLNLQEYENGKLTGREIKKEISYILKHDSAKFGIKKGYCILGLSSPYAIRKK